MKDKLSTVVFVNGNKAISPPLVTVREYARWLEKVFDEYTCNYELYLKATAGDTKVLEFHPGTRIGQYFDNTHFNSDKYKSWYIYQESSMMNKLNKMNMASYKDTTSNKGLKLLRLYSVDQVELYVRTKIDRTFDINNFLVTPKKVVIQKSDFKNIIIPYTCQSRKSLLDKPVQMTVSDIERRLGHKISIIS